MLELKKILVPVDFSERSAAAAEHAAVIAARFDAETIFLHAIAPGPYEHGFFDAGYTASAVWPSREEMQERLGEQLRELAERVGRGRRIETLVVWGDPATRIVEAAEHEQPDLVMLPTHGYGRFRRLVLGSVTTKVLHDARFPVYTGAHVEDIPDAVVDPYDRVLCAIDLGPRSERILRWAAGFAQAWNADLHVVHAAPPLDAYPADGQYFAADLRQTLVQTRAEQIDEMLGKLGVSAQVDVDCADVEEFVVGAATASSADALVIGRPEDESFLGRLRAHSLGLIRKAPCPVVSI